MTGAAQQKEEHVAEVTEATVESYFTTLSNWGRWGTDDRKGTLNLITPEVRQAGAAAVRHGRSVSLSRNIDPLNPDPLYSGVAVVQRFMGLNEVKDHVGRELRYEALTEYIGIAPHGSNTHVDGLAHYSWEGKNYNGFPADAASSRFGSPYLDVTAASDGIVTRGVLLDIAGLFGVPYVERGYAITPDDLAAAETRQGITVAPGDALLIHTGNAAVIQSEGPDYVESFGRRVNKQAGLHLTCLPYLRDLDIAVMGADATHDVQPAYLADRSFSRPIHSVCLVALGLWLIDNMELADLAQACAELQQWDFLFTVAPWRMLGVTSSPVNPVAVL